MSSNNTGPPQHHAECELCTQDGGLILWRDDRCRVVLIADPDYAGFCRVIWGSHVKEMTDLAPAAQAHCMQVVFAVERAVRTVLNPHKINLASLGNMTPHLHWHVIPREVTDPHFPDSIWAARKRSAAKAEQTGFNPEAGARLGAEIARLLHE
jgi:diadenosine tetraphosphate (Ap4A) HIT family hydrolase